MSLLWVVLTSFMVLVPPLSTEGTWSWWRHLHSSSGVWLLWGPRALWHATHCVTLVFMTSLCPCSLWLSLSASPWSWMGGQAEWPLIALSTQSLGLGGALGWRYPTCTLGPILRGGWGGMYGPSDLHSPHHVWEHRVEECWVQKCKVQDLGREVQCEKSLWPAVTAGISEPVSR